MMCKNCHLGCLKDIRLCWGEDRSGHWITESMQLNSSKFSSKHYLKQLYIYKGNFPPTATAILKVTEFLSEHLRLQE